MKKVINIPGAPKPIGPYSQALLINNLLYISGQIPIDPVSGQMVQGEITVHTKQVMQNIAALLAEAGMDFSNVVKTTIFIADMNDFVKVNEIYSSYFVSDFPARETVQAARLPRDSKIEISVIASF
ncbi:MAG: RidA family protein [Bacteroidota bacterium]